MDLSKAFDHIRHDFIIAKLATYGIERKNLRLIYFYLRETMYKDKQYL